MNNSFRLKDIVTCDVELYVNYLLVKFKHLASGKYISIEKYEGTEFNRQNLRYLLGKYTSITFNGLKYDQPIIEAACAGMPVDQLKMISNDIIENNLWPWQISKKYGIPTMDFDHVDIREVLPLSATLKIYGGRLGCKNLMDLPIEHTAVLTEEQMKQIDSYCGIDLDVTGELFEFCSKEVQLRVDLSEKYNIDLRSKSDAQIAEAVIKSELKKRYNITAKKPSIKTGTEFYYVAPDYVEFESEELNDLLNFYTTEPLVVQASGHLSLVFGRKEKVDKKTGEVSYSNITNRVIRIGSTDYTVGVGGIHSKEKRQSIIAGKGKKLKDIDVEAFYPNIIVKNKYSPKHLGKYFLPIYQGFIDTRLKAKHSGNNSVNQSLKIVINGTFGKLASKYSILFAPDLMAQVTITGQLSLLMLIEQMEKHGIQVVSANTDGIVLYYDEELEELSQELIEDWEFATNYTMEETRYKSLNSRDVNNYVAVTLDGKIKGKGAYADLTDDFYRLRSNPTGEICTTAVYEFLKDSTPVEETIRSCTNIKKFLHIRTVNGGGAVKNGKLIGKSVRWYYSNDDLDAIRYAGTGKKVATTDGAALAMVIPDSIPDDLDYERYIEISKKMLKDLGR